jgi:periplasmic copper chaperone A
MRGLVCGLVMVGLAACSPDEHEDHKAAPTNAVTPAPQASVSGAPVELSVVIKGGKVRTPTQGRPTGGYMDVTNDGANGFRITAASSADFARVELHTHEMKDGMMAMREIDGVDVPAGQTVSFAPGGLHLMLFEPTRALKKGDTITVALQFGDAGGANATLLVVDEIPRAH